MRNQIVALLISGCFAAPKAWAQVDLVTTPPANFVIPNYNSTSVGPYGGLEGAGVRRRASPIRRRRWFQSGRSGTGEQCANQRECGRLSTDDAHATPLCRTKEVRSSNCPTSSALRSCLVSG